MYDLYDLITLKSKDAPTQRSVLGEFTRRCLESKVNFLDMVETDGVINLTSEPPERVAKYFLLAVYAADVASVPYPEGRARHIERLREIIEENNLSYDKVVYLTKYSDPILQELENM